MKATILRVRIFRVIASLICLSAISPADASERIPLVDSPDGMTCRHYAFGFLLPWLKQGGDWLDASGEAHGPKPYAASAPLAVRSGRQQVEIDISALAKTWNEGGEPLGGILLRAVPGRDSGLANFASRENPDTAAHPQLTMKWSDGSTSVTKPIADADLPCSTRASVGKRPQFQVGAGGAILVFPFEPRRGVSLTSARLVLTSDKQYGNKPLTIGVYRPLLPWMKMSEGVGGIAANFVGDQGIQKHPDLIFAERFESGDWLSSWSDIDKTGDAEPVTANKPERFEPIDGKALRVTVRKGKKQGLNMHYRFAQAGRDEPEEVFFRYALRLGESWDPSLEGGKMPGLSGTYGRAGWGGRKADGRNGWAARGSFFRIQREKSPLSHLRGIGTYLYQADMSDAYGDVYGWGLGPSGALEKNRWYSIEQQVRMNRPGERDGILRAWVDGKLVFEKTNVRYRDIPDLRIESLWMNVYHGGTRATNKDLTLFIDNVVLARKYIGPVAPAR